MRLIDVQPFRENRAGIPKEVEVFLTVLSNVKVSVE